ncbi:hypothetical protein pb186bvf_016600 [Paramecium bursaria]
MGTEIITTEYMRSDSKILVTNLNCVFCNYGNFRQQYNVKHKTIIEHDRMITSSIAIFVVYSQLNTLSLTFSFHQI